MCILHHWSHPRCSSWIDCVEPGTCPLRRPAGIRPRSAPVHFVHSGHIPDRGTTRLRSPPVRRWRSIVRVGKRVGFEWSGISCPPGNRLGAGLDVIKPAPSKSQQDSVHMAGYTSAAGQARCTTSVYDPHAQRNGRKSGPASWPGTHSLWSRHETEPNMFLSPTSSPCGSIFPHFRCAPHSRPLICV